MSPNEYRGETTLTIEGVERVVVLDWNAIAVLKDELGPNLYEELQDIVVNLNVEGLSVMLAAALKKRWPEITPALVREFSPPFLLATNAIREAVNLAFYGTAEPEEISKEVDPPATGENGATPTGSERPEPEPLSKA